MSQYMQHFANQTWQIQGPDFERNIQSNLDTGRIAKGRMYTDLPKVKEALIIGNGPSLDKNKHLLTGLPRDIYVICCDSALPKVEEFVHPDLVTCLEATAESLPDLQQWWKDVETSEYTLCTVINADSGLFQLWKGPYYFFNVAFLFPSTARLASKIRWMTGADPITTGGNCGVMSLVLAYNLGAQRITLVGMDHSTKVDTNPADVSVSFPDIHGEHVWLPWNFYVGQWEMRALAKDMKTARGTQVVNCTEGGVLYEPGTIDGVDLSTFLREYQPVEVRRTGDVVELDVSDAEVQVR